eukprot:Awhi_evm2s6336
MVFHVGNSTYWWGYSIACYLLISVLYLTLGSICFSEQVDPDIDVGAASYVSNNLASDPDETFVNLIGLLGAGLISTTFEIYPLDNECRTDETFVNLIGLLGAGLISTTFEIYPLDNEPEIGIAMKNNFAETVTELRIQIKLLHVYNRIIFYGLEELLKLESITELFGSITSKSHEEIVREEEIYNVLFGMVYVNVLNVSSNSLVTILGDTYISTRDDLSDEIYLKYMLPVIARLVEAFGPCLGVLFYYF